MTITFDLSVLREMIEQSPEHFEDSPECPECGRPMTGSKTEDGPFCVFDHGDT